jgi:hypothetical protein
VDGASRETHDVKRIDVTREADAYRRSLDFEQAAARLQRWQGATREAFE